MQIFVDYLFIRVIMVLQLQKYLQNITKVYFYEIVFQDKPNRTISKY